VKQALQKLSADARVRGGIRLVVVVALFYFLWQKDIISLDATRVAFRNWQPLCLGFVLALIASQIGMYRWHLLVHAQGIPMPLSKSMQLGFVGVFFSMALPGAVSGDLIKALYAAKGRPDLRAKSFGSILFDRFVGVSFLLVNCTIAMFLGWNEPWAGEVLSSLRLAVAVVGVGIIAFYTYIFVVSRRWDPVHDLLTWGTDRIRFVGSFLRIYEAVRLYRNSPRTMLISLVLTVVLHFLVTTSCVLYARSLGLDQLPLLGLFVVIPMGLLVTGIPILPGGLGTGHGAFLFLFNLFGSSRGADVFNLYFLGQMIVAAIGGLIYLRFKAESPLTKDLEGAALDFQP
jgi:uncharacterized protein (TIRG00374 family)